NRALRELVLKFPCSDEHWRLARYLEYHEEKYRLLDTSLYEYLKMKADLRLGRTRVSGVQWLALSLDIPYEVRVSDAVRAALLTNTEKITADHLYDGLNTQDFDSRERLATIFQAARLLSRAGYSSIAMRHYEEVIGSRNLTDEIRTEEGQRFLLAYFQTAIRLDFDGGLDSIMEHADSIVFPELFDRLFQDMLSRLVREERWAALSDLYTEAGAYWTEGQRARLAWILAEGSRVGREVKLDRLDLLREAAHQDSNAYYSAVAQVALGKSLKLPLAEVQQEESLVQYEYPLQEYESLAESLYAARLTRLAYMVAREHPEAFDANQLAAFAKVHYEDGQYILGMRLLDRLGRVSDDRRSISQASLQRYPLAFREEMQPVLDRYDLYPPVFIALVREESYFDPGISSHVGANGLAQLMPDTAADMARLLRLKNPDLSDPATNLSIGGLYLYRLLQRFEIPVLGLIAYNAGQGRVSRWRREKWASSSIILHEGLPYEETRHYIRKIFVTALHYGYLYHDASPGEIFSYLFSDIQSHNLE
ncbi:MAG: hypothetical protein D6B26_02290, partial [Spirochaetaceae bacterium]